MCLASGPSITAEQVEKVRRWKVIAVNDCYRLAPWADVLYAADVRWWKWHQDKLGDVKSIRVTIENPGQVPPEDVYVLRNLSSVPHPQQGYSRDPTGLITGLNSGYQAIGIAIHAGCKRIVLLGYDMKTGEGGKMHFFGDHPIATKPSILRTWRLEFEKMAKALAGSGIEVLNASPDTHMEAFSLRTLESLLADSKATLVSA